MEKTINSLINRLIETIKKQYNQWKWIRTRHFTSTDNFNDSEKIDQIQKYYYWFTEDSHDRLSDAFKRINNPETKIQKLLQSNNILLDLYSNCFCCMNEPPNTLYWSGIEELFIIYCNEILEERKE